MSKKSQLESEDIAWAMAQEPIVDKTPEEIRKEYYDNKSVENLVKLYAEVSNEFWWVEDNVYDFEEGTDEYRKACDITNSWRELLDELENEIFSILKKDGIKIPKTGTIEVLAPFMKKYGYIDGRGWWIPESEI